MQSEEQCSLRSSAVWGSQSEEAIWEKDHPFGLSIVKDQSEFVLTIMEQFCQGLAGADLLGGNTLRGSQPSSSHQGQVGTGSQSCLSLWRPLSHTPTTAWISCRFWIVHQEIWSTDENKNIRNAYSKPTFKTGVKSDKYFLKIMYKSVSLLKFLEANRWNSCSI